MTSHLQDPPAGNTEPSPDFDPILDIPIKLNANLGRVKLSVADLLALDAGSILELDKDVGAPIDLYINDQLVAKGEVILINEKLGISILDIASENGNESA